jgi:hypothetical protein
MIIHLSGNHGVGKSTIKDNLLYSPFCEQFKIADLDEMIENFLNLSGYKTAGDFQTFLDKFISANKNIIFVGTLPRYDFKVIGKGRQIEHMFIPDLKADVKLFYDLPVEDNHRRYYQRYVNNYVTAIWNASQNGSQFEMAFADKKYIKESVRIFRDKISKEILISNCLNLSEIHRSENYEFIQSEDDIYTRIFTECSNTA